MATTGDSSPIDFKEKRVLIVDDHPGMRTSIRITLSNFGVVFSDVAQTANDAIRRIGNKHYDIIICDYNLGDAKDGQQLLEELRHQKLISLATVFMMVTAERAYEKVVAAAELAPDDYLIKPFTADILRGRLERIIRKKAVLSPIHRMAEQGQTADAILLCEELLQAKTPYAIDVLRLKAEIHVMGGDFAAAEAIYEQVIAMRAIPWARLGLARMLHFQERHEEAEVLLSGLVEDAPEFLSAYDLLARVHEAQEQGEKAQAVLKEAVALSPKTLKRQKAMGDLAYRNGDLTSAEEAFRTVVKQGRYSHLRDPGDYANLARVCMDQGKLGEALGATREASQSFGGSGKAAFTVAVMESLIHNKAGDEKASMAALVSALKARKEANLSLSEDQSLDLANACFINGEDELGRELVSHVVRSNHDSNALIGKARRLFQSLGRAEEGERLIDAGVKDIIRLNNEGVLKAREGDLRGAIKLLSDAASQLPDNLQIVLNAAHALLTFINKNGWDEVMAEQCRTYLGKARSKDAAHPKLLQLVKLYDDAAQRFGVSA